MHASPINRSHLPFASWPCFDEELVEVVAEVLRSGKVNYWTGENGRRFEEEYAHSVGCQHAIATANGTLALELGLYALNIGPGDEVIVPSRTFIASASSVVARGASPVVADVDEDGGVLTAQTVERRITPRTKAIIAVHLAGWPCGMEELSDLCRPKGIAIVEDCAQAHGAAYRDQPVGSLGDVAAFSFCQDKILTTGGEGGMLTTNRKDLWDRAWRYKDHGKRPDAFYDAAPATNAYRWLHDSFGSNFRMTEMQAAIGRVLLRRLPDWSDHRRQNAQQLTEACREFASLRVPEPPAHLRHAYYKFYAYVRPEFLADGWNRDRVMSEIRSLGVPCFSGSCSEIYREGAFPPELRPEEPLPAARRLGETSLMFLVHPTLTQENLRRACLAIQDVMGLASTPTSRSAA